MLAHPASAFGLWSVVLFVMSFVRATTILQIPRLPFAKNVMQIFVTEQYSSKFHSNLIDTTHFTSCAPCMFILYCRICTAVKCLFLEKVGKNKKRVIHLDSLINSLVVLLLILIINLQQINICTYNQNIIFALP